MAYRKKRKYTPKRSYGKKRKAKATRRAAPRPQTVNVVIEMREPMAPLDPMAARQREVAKRRRHF